MHADGTGQRTVHVKVRVQTEGVALQYGVLSCSSSAGCELVLVPNSNLETEQP